MGRPLVLFDLDGTLIDSAAWLLASVNRVLAPYLPAPWTREDLVATAGGPEHQVFARIVPPDALAGVLEAYAAALAAPGVLRPQPGAEALLDGLAADGAALAVFSGAGRRLGELRLRHVGWTERFAVRVWGDETAPKPAPDGVRLALARAGAARADTVFVGDTEKDSEAARAAGVRFLGVAWGDRPGGPPDCEVCATPERLLARLRALLGLEPTTST